MAHPLGQAAIAPERGKRLDSWKEIATYLKRGVRTVQRWEREAGLPVHRLLTEKRGDIHAYTSEIDSWWQTRSSVLAPSDGNLDLWIRSGPGGDPNRLTSTPEHEFDAAFSPDSRRILYSVSSQKPAAMMEVEGAPPPGATSLFESDLSSPARLLAAHAGSGRYSPDGRWIALLRSTSASGEIEFGLLPAAGGGFTPIPLRTSADDVLQSCSAPVWSADSRWILLSARTRKTGRYNRWLVDVSARAALLTPATEEMMAAGFTAAPVLAGLAPQAWLSDGTVLTKGFDSGAIGIWAVGFDPRSRHIRGKPTRVPAPVTELRWFSIAGTKIVFDGGDLASPFPAYRRNSHGVHKI